MEKAEAGVTILPSDWPGRELSARPGDLSNAVPQGLGLNVPIMITPYGVGPDLGYYGLDRPSSDAFKAAPTQEPCGGVLYFDDGVDVAMLRNALVVIGVHMPRKDYAVFAAEAKDPVAERYLDQVRIISKGALGQFFAVGEEARALPDQALTLGEYVERFVAEQKEKWGDGYTFSAKLRGTLGGDGDWAKESLAFGFLVENTYWSVYRLWSRPWLVTK